MKIWYFIFIIIHLSVFTVILWRGSDIIKYLYYYIIHDGDAVVFYILCVRLDIWESSSKLTGEHGIQAAVLVFVSDLHGHRGLAHQSAAGQRHLRMDCWPLPLLQERAHRMEEQRPAQPFAEQVFQKSGKSSRKPILFILSFDVTHHRRLHQESIVLLQSWLSALLYYVTYNII